MNDLYNALFTASSVLLGAVMFFVLLTLYHWFTDYRVTGWRKQRWEAGKRDIDGKWTEWFAWRPVTTVSGNVVWWETVYRQIGNSYVDNEDWTWYYYASLLDVIKYI